MKYIFFYCLFSVLRSQEIFRLNKRVIDVFFKNINFLCVVHNNDLNNLGIIDGLTTRNIKTYNQIDIVNGSKRTECGNSVLIARDEKVLDSILVKKHEYFLFRVQSTILVFFRGTEEINIQKYRTLAIGRDIDVIVVKGLGLKSLFPPKERKAQLTIYSAMKNEILMNCSSLRMSCFANFTYERTKWTPFFMLTKLRKEFRIAFSIYPPFVIRNEDRLAGVDIEVAKLLTEGWPVQFKYLGNDEHRKRFYHHKHPVHLINSSEADLVIGGAQTVGEKSTTYPYSSQCNTFLVHGGQFYPDSTFTFQFFQTYLWVALICSLIFMALLMKLSSGIYGRQYSLTHTLVLVIGYISSYGVPPFPPPKHTFMRFISLWWCFISLIIATYFSAGLTSSLRIPRTYGIISTWEEMLQNGIRWLDISNESMTRMRNYRGGLKALAELFQLEPSYEIVNQKLRTKKYAVRVEKFERKILNIIGGLDEYGKNYMKILDNCYALHHIRYELNYNSPFLDFLNIRLFHIVEAGFVDYVFEDLSNKREISYMKNFFMKKPTFNRLFTLRRLTGCFILLGSGCILGLLGLFLEFGVYQFREQKRKERMRRNFKKRKR